MENVEPPGSSAEGKLISDHYRRIGAKGGRKTSPAKSSAARAAARIRWGHSVGEPIPIATSELKDGGWYRGTGRNGNVAMWDGLQRCFWITAVNDLPDPALYPEGGTRSVRLKQEGHSSDEGGTFSPMTLLGEDS